MFAPQMAQPQFVPFQQPQAQPQARPQVRMPQLLQAPQVRAPQQQPQWTAQPRTNTPAALSGGQLAVNQRPVPARPPIPPQLIVRGQNSNDEPIRKTSTASLSLPTPDALGIRPANIGSDLPTTSVSLDWNQIHSRLRQLNPLGINSNRLPSGNYRVTLVLATAQSSLPQTFEAVANSESHAYATALQQAERWAQQK